jgi:hypothetical protein
LGGWWVIYVESVSLYYIVIVYIVLGCENPEILGFYLFKKQKNRVKKQKNRVKKQKNRVIINKKTE